VQTVSELSAQPRTRARTRCGSCMRCACACAGPLRARELESAQSSAARPVNPFCARALRRPCAPPRRLLPCATFAPPPPLWAPSQRALRAGACPLSLASIGLSSLLMLLAPPSRGPPTEDLSGKPGAPNPPRVQPVHRPVPPPAPPSLLRPPSSPAAPPRRPPSKPPPRPPRLAPRPSTRRLSGVETQRRRLADRLTGLWCSRAPSVPKRSRWTP
jgi:hypothetical protein